MEIKPDLISGIFEGGGGSCEPIAIGKSTNPQDNMIPIVKGRFLCFHAGQKWETQAAIWLATGRKTRNLVVVFYDGKNIDDMSGSVYEKCDSDSRNGGGSPTTLPGTRKKVEQTNPRCGCVKAGVNMCLLLCKSGWQATVRYSVREAFPDID